MNARDATDRSAASPLTATAPAVLEIEGLTVMLRGDGPLVPLVEGVSLSVQAGRTLGVVGESGCGKSITALSILGLNPRPATTISAGTIKLDGRDLMPLPEAEMRKVRGNKVSMIFQEPMTSLNPLLTVGRQVAEPMLLHRKMSRAEAARQAIEMLRLVQIPEPEARASEYPHQLSGGMRQRVMVAMALACDPRLLIADEPTTALDVTIQAQVLRLMRDIQRRLGTAILLITHDMGVIAENAEEVAVMYAGQLVEFGAVAAIFANPQHPYTFGLLRSVLEIRTDPIQPGERLHTVPGTVPPAAARPMGCVFSPRCLLATDICRNERPRLTPKATGQQAACHHSDRITEIA